MDGIILAKRCFPGDKPGFVLRRGVFAKTFSSISRCICALSLIAALLMASPAQAQELEANHFILLVDASGSVRDTGGYAAFLRNAVIPQLYEGRLGDKVPAFNPEQDVLTLLHFGVCPIDECPLVSAYRYLSKYNLATDFVHPVFVHQAQVTARQLRAQIKPTRYYRYTALSWAEPMALWFARPPAESEVPRRTFLLAVTDGEPNEHTPQREIRMLQQRADPASLREAEQRVEAIGAAYLFSDGEDRAGVAHHVFYPDSDNPKYFLEAYEVLAQNALDWKAEVEALDRPYRLSFGWTDQSDESPRGALRASLSGDLRDLIDRDDGQAWVNFAYEDTTQTARFDPRKTLRLPVTVPGPLTYASRTYTARLGITTVHQDSMLGPQVVSYRFPEQTILTPTPTIYTLQHWTPRVLGLLGVLAVLGMFGYALYFRFAATHLEIELPGKLKRIRLRRGKRHHDVAFSSPRKDLPALTLHPPRWMWLFAPLYKGATVTLDTDGQAGAARWQTPEGRTPQLDTVTEGVSAFWDHVGTEPTDVTLRFRQGSQESVVTVSYPAGAKYNVRGSRLIRDGS